MKAWNSCALRIVQGTIAMAATISATAGSRSARSVRHGLPQRPMTIGTASTDSAGRSSSASPNRSPAATAVAIAGGRARAEIRSTTIPSTSGSASASDSSVPLTSTSGG